MSISGCVFSECACVMWFHSVIITKILIIQYLRQYWPFKCASLRKMTGFLTAKLETSKFF